MIWTRRELFQLAAAPLVPVKAPAITQVQVAPAVYPTVGHFKFFPKPERPTVLVKVTCEDGSVGWGQSVPVPTWSYETMESVLSTLENYIAPVLIGGNPFDLKGAHQAMNAAIRPSPW